MSILDLHDPGEALPRYIAPPKTRPEPKFSAWSMLSSVPRGVAGAVADVSATALEALEPFGATVGRMYGETPEPGFGRKMAEDVRVGWAENMAPDAQTSHAAEQVLYQFARGATKIMAGSALAGPAGVVAMGGEEAVTQTRELQRKGVDDATAWKAGGVQGAGLALAALPLLGKTLTQTAALYLAGGPGGFMAQQALTREILQAGGYDQIGAQYDPFDPVGLAVSSLIPAVFTAAGIRSQRKAAAVQREVADAARVALQAEQRRMSNPAPDVPRSADLHEAALVKAEDAIARGEPVAVVDVAPRYGAVIAESRLGDLIDTREAGQRFHGTSRPIASLSDEYAMSGDNRNIYGQGFYTTDAIDIAEGYSKKGRGKQPTLYEVTESPVRLFDMDAPMTDELRTMIRSAVGDADYEGSSSLIDNAKTLREWFDEFRRESPSLGLSRDAVHEVWDSIRYNLEADGYRGYKHTGGGNTGKQAHDVRIYWFPEQDVSISASDFARYRVQEFSVSLDKLRAAMNKISGQDQPPAVAKPEPAAPAPDNVRPDAAAVAAQAVAGRPAETPGVAAEQAAAPTRMDAIRAQFPDLMVQMDGMDKPMRLDDFLKKVDAEAAEIGADADLLQTAVECALTNGF